MQQEGAVATRADGREQLAGEREEERLAEGAAEAAEEDCGGGRVGRGIGDARKGRGHA